MPFDIVARVIGSCSGFGMGASLEGLDVVTIEEFGNPSLVRTNREHVSNIIKSYFEQHSIMTQAQILHGLIKHKKLEQTTILLGFRDARRRKEHGVVIENVTKSLSSFGKSKKNDI